MPSTNWAKARKLAQRINETKERLVELNAAYKVATWAAIRDEEANKRHVDAILTDEDAMPLAHPSKREMRLATEAKRERQLDAQAFGAWSRGEVPLDNS